MRIERALLCLFLCFGTLAAIEVDAKESAIDAALSKDLLKLQKSAYGDDAVIEKANTQVIKTIMQLLPQKEMLRDPLKKSTEAGLSIVESSDHKIRYYTYDTNTGGTMHFFEMFVQYDAGGGKVKFTRLNPPPSSGDGADRSCGGLYTKIESVKTQKGKTVYLAFDVAIFDGMDRSNSIHAVEIANGKLVPSKFFKTKTSVLDEISCQVHAMPDAPGQEIELKDNGKKMLVPLLKEDGNPTGKYLIYLFDGNQFVYKNAGKG